MGSSALIPVRSPGLGASPEPAALASAAHALCDGGYLAEAETLARWLVQQHPHFSGGRVVLGRALFEMERLDDAADVLRATTIQYPASVAAYRWLAEVLVRQSLWARAKAVLNQAAMLSPANRRIGQLQRLAGQEGERAEVMAEETTTRAMDLPRMQSRRVLPPPVPAQGLSRRERRNPLTETEATPAGVAPPDTPLYARSDFGHSSFETDSASSALGDDNEAAPARLTLQWPPAPSSLALAVPLLESASFSSQLQPIQAVEFEGTSSVTWKGIPMLDAHWKSRWHKGAGWLGALAGTMLIGFVGVRWLLHESTSHRPANVATPLRSEPAAAEAAALDQLLLIGTPASLRTVIDASRSGKTRPSDPGDDLAEALLFLDYGWKPASLHDDRKADTTPGPDAILASRVFTLLAQGQLAQARELVQGTKAASPSQPWIALAEARVLQHLGNIDAARARLDTSESLPAKIVAAELFLDDGRAAAALDIVSAQMKITPDHPRLAALFAEASDNLSAHKETPGNTCAATLGPNLFARCSARAASVLRRQGSHEEAERQAVTASHQATTDPRTIAATALVLYNLGHPEAARPLVKRLSTTTAPVFRGRTWAELAQLMAKDPANASAIALAQAPTSPEERLAYARVSYARAGSPALAAAIDSMGVDAVRADEDLRWWRMLTQYNAGPALELSKKLQAARKPLGPVGTFIAGLLAADSRRVTSAWMSLALTMPGYADHCWAALRFSSAQTNLGLNPLHLPAYKRLVSSGQCNGN